MKNMTCRLVTMCLGFVGTLAVSMPALAMTNEEAVQSLKLTQFVLPIFPDAVKEDGLTTGWVTAIVSHDNAGQTTDVLVVDSTHPRFTEAVRDAVTHWKFSPEANVGSTQAPLVRFYFSSKGVIMIQCSGMGRVITADMPSDTVRFPTFGSLDSQPRALEQPMPVFPQALRGRVNSGTATVTFYVDETGRARAAVVTEASSPEFAEAAREAVAQWRYEAPRQNGRPVVAVQNWNFRFGGPSGT